MLPVWADHWHPGAVLLADSVVLAVLNDRDSLDLFFYSALVACALVGGVVVARRPINPVGWFFWAALCGPEHIRKRVRHLWAHHGTGGAAPGMGDGLDVKLDFCIGHPVDPGLVAALLSQRTPRFPHWHWFVRCAISLIVIRVTYLPLVPG